VGVFFPISIAEVGGALYLPSIRAVGRIAREFWGLLEFGRHLPADSVSLSHVCEELWVYKLV